MSKINGKENVQYTKSNHEILTHIIVVQIIIPVISSFMVCYVCSDYLLHRKNASWLYLSRLAALREFAYLKALYDHGFPVPIPYEASRHTILMSHVDGVPL